MDLISESLKNIAPSMTLRITAEANKLKAEGKDICGFGAGEPDFDTPDHIKAAAAKALGEGMTKYTPASGLLELREGLAKKLSKDNVLTYDPSQITVSCGAKQACFNAILALCNPGDEVLIPAPYWVSYPEMVHMVGAEPIFIQTTLEDGWKITPEQFEENISPKTKMIILNSPSNPTGAIYTKSELEAIAEVALSEDIAILSDEIYEKLIYDDNKHVSIASLGKEIYDLTITVNGFSKAYSMTGWRVGYSAAPKEIAAVINKIQSHTTSNATSFAQAGAIAALESDENVIKDMLEEFDMRRRYMMGRLEKIKRLKFTEPLGAFYFLVDISALGLKSVNFAEKLLSHHHVSVVPGIAFGDDKTIRLSYAASLDIIKNGLDRLQDFCKAH